MAEMVARLTREELDQLRAQVGTGPQVPAAARDGWEPATHVERYLWDQVAALAETRDRLVAELERQRHTGISGLYVPRRERQMLLSLAVGETIAAAARRLGMSSGAVGGSRSRLYGRLGCTGPGAAVAVGLEHGVITLDQVRQLRAHLSARRSS